MKKILAIVGSLREGSLNRQLALLAKDAIGESAKFEILDYKDLEFYNGDIEFPAPKSVMRIRTDVRNADALWFFTPEYNHFFSGVLKNLIDWLSRPISKEIPQVLADKPVAISGISVGPSGTVLAQDHLVTLLSFLNMRIMNSPRLIIPNGLEQAKDEELILTRSEEQLKEQADSFLEFI